jgi:hypothetical protein
VNSGGLRLSAAENSFFFVAHVLHGGSNDT